MYTKEKMLAIVEFRLDYFKEEYDGITSPTEVSGLPSHIKDMLIYYPNPIYIKNAKFLLMV